MLRTTATILIVAAISSWISWGEQTAGLTAHATDWVRTVDGWQSRRTVEARRSVAPPAVHPAVIAGFQLTASLLFLAAFPARARMLGAATPRSVPGGHLRSAAISVAHA